MRMYSRSEVKRPFHRQNWWIVLLLLGAFALYTHQLDGMSLWRDEALTIARAEQSFWHIFANRNIVQGVESPDLHPPFYFLIMHLWQQGIGSTEFAYRLPSALFMLLALALFYHVGRVVWGRQTAVFSLLLAILSPFFYWYAREARMYALMVLETLIFFRILWQVLQPNSPRWQFALLGGAALLLVGTHYSGIFVLAFAIAIVTLVHFQKRPSWGWWLAGLGVLLAGSVLLMPHLLELLALPEFFAFAQRPLWVLAQEGINTFSLGSTEPMEAAGWRLLPFALLGIVGMATLDVSSKTRRWRIFLLGTGGFLITLLAFFAASWLKANYSNPRHLTVLAVPWFLLMGNGIAAIWRHQRVVAVGLGLLAGAVSGLALQQTVSAPPIIKDDVRALAAYIEARRQPGDVVLWHDAPMMATYDFYASDLPYTAVPQFGNNDPAVALEQLNSLSEQYDRIWFVSSPAAAYFNAQLLPDWLEAHRFRADTAEFPASWASLHLSLFEQLDETAVVPPTALPIALIQGSYQLQALIIEERFSSEGVWASLFWTVTEADEALSPPSVCLRLQDSSQTVWSEGCADLNLPRGIQPEAGHLYRQQLWLPLSLGIPAISYQAAVQFGDSFEPVGFVQLPSWETAVPQTALASYPAAALQLVSLNWNAPNFRAGLWVLGNLLWFTEAPLPPDLTVDIRLVNFWGRPIAEQTTLVGSKDYPTSQWPAASYSQTLLAVPLPFSAEGKYRVQVKLADSTGTMLEPDRWGRNEWITVGSVTVTPWPIIKTLPTEAIPLGQSSITFGEDILLAGYQLDRKGDQVVVELFWQNSAPLNDDYGVFVHVGRPNEAPIAQSSNGPANWLRPTSSWRVGEIIQDSHPIMLPPLDLEEDLMISVGLYDLDDPTIRLPLRVLNTAVPSNSYTLQPLPPN